RPLSEILAAIPRVPQILRNVRVSHKPDLASLRAVTEAAARATEQLGKTGRLVLRYSGTEPLCRIMIESIDAELVDTLADELEMIINREIGARD
ncbi:MAG: phosphoglucosamine mutase, partial [Acidobacteriota bacterium]|nr:phosphoglucosamine mutase [Acidobacteriota bacterium]